MNWINAKENKPKRINECWCPEETAQEVLIQYIRAKRICFAVAFFEGGDWFVDDVKLDYEVLVYSEIMSEKKCYDCLGSGRNTNKESDFRTCLTCHGTGKNI